MKKRSRRFADFQKRKKEKKKLLFLTCTIATSMPLASNFSVSRNWERPGTSASGSTRGTAPPGGGTTDGDDDEDATTTSLREFPRPPRRWLLGPSSDRSSDGMEA